MPPLRLDLELSSGSNPWKVSLARVAYDWEVNIFASFFSLLYLISGRWEGKASFGGPPPKGWFNVRSFYCVVVRMDDSSFSWKSTWQTKAPL